MEYKQKPNKSQEIDTKKIEKLQRKHMSPNLEALHNTN
jgi:hypothetical protein